MNRGVGRMVRACITIRIDPRRRDDAVDAVRSVVGPTRAEPGCLNCCLYSDVDDDCLLSLIEEWATTDLFRKRLRSQNYMNVLLIIEMSLEPPQVHFDTVTARRGIEVIHEERERATS